MKIRDPKLIFFVSLEYGDSQGGAGVYAYEVTKSLLELGYTIHLFVPDGTPVTNRHSATLIVHRVKLSRISFLKTLSWTRNLRAEIKYVSKNHMPSIVHVNTIQALNASIIGAKYIATIHHPISSEEKYAKLADRLMYFVFQRMEKRTIRRADQIIAVSTLTENLLISQYSFIKSKIRVIGNGIDTNRYLNYKPKKMVPPAGGGSLLILAPGCGRERRKGAEGLIKALEALPNGMDFRCIITGSSRVPGWSETFDDLVFKSKIRSSLLLVGEIDRPLLKDYFFAADIVVYPSLFEGFGLPILEAMAAGKPIIASKTGESPAIITNGHTGLLFDVGHSMELSDAIRSLATDEELRLRIGKNAQKHIVQNYDSPKLSNQLVALYRNAVRSY